MATKQEDLPVAEFLKAVAKQVRNNPDNPYIILGLPPASDEERIKIHHRHLATYFHPDKWPNGVPAMFSGVMEAINAASDLLRDETRRKQLDTTMHLHKLVCPRCKGLGELHKSKGFRRKEIVDCEVCEASGWYGLGARTNSYGRDILQ